MSSAMSAYAELPLELHRLVLVDTYHPAAPLWSLVPFLRGAGRLLFQHGPEAWSIVHVHLSERGSFVREGALVVLARLRRIPTVVTLHGADLRTFSSRHPRLVRFVLRRAAVVVTLGPVTAEWVRSFVGPGPRVIVVPNPVAVPEDPPLPATGDNVLFAGEVGRRKGADVLLQAWPLVVAQRPGARLTMAGPYADVHPGSLPGVRWLGPVAHRQIQDLLDESALVVLPSRAEVMPMFLLEAMARSRPVVATDAGEVPYLLGEAGMLVPIGDPVALADTIVAALADRAGSAERGVALRRRAQELFSSKVVADRLDAIYSTLHAARGAGPPAEGRRNGAATTGGGPP
jgi:glycosyltransferase involved in cell wall biosynthesis